MSDQAREKLVKQIEDGERRRAKYSTLTSEGSPGTPTTRPCDLRGTISVLHIKKGGPPRRKATPPSTTSSHLQAGA